MLGKLLLLVCLCFASIGVAFAVNVNTADAVDLQSIKGLGASKSQAIVEERQANGPFSDADDLADRIKGLGTKSVAKLQEAGLTIAPSPAADKVEGKAISKTDTKAPGKAASRAGARAAATPAVKSN